MPGWSGKGVLKHSATNVLGRKPSAPSCTPRQPSRCSVRVSGSAAAPIPSNDPGTPGTNASGAAEGSGPMDAAVLDMAASGSSSGSSISRTTTALPAAATEAAAPSSSSSSSFKQEEEKAAPSKEDQLWWVEKFEARRRAEEAGAAAGSSSRSPDSGYSSSTGPVGAGQGRQQAPALKRLLLVMGQLLQLGLANAALILWPASLVTGGLGHARVWLLYLAYMLFFAGGSVSRILKYGALAKASKDKQRSSWTARASLFAFILTMPVVHWAPMRAFCILVEHSPEAFAAVMLYDLLGACLMIGALALNWAAAASLGAAYNRVVAPDTLVTTGPYAVVQHPIYTSYMMLFAGYCMLLHSAPNALLVVAICLAYYSVRCRLEGQVLRDAFGENYEEYIGGKKRFVPFVI